MVLPTSSACTIHPSIHPCIHAYSQTRLAVDHDVADQLRIELGGRIESKACLAVIILKVAVDGLRQADHARLEAHGPIVLGEQARVRIRVVPPNDDKAVEVVVSRCGARLLKLLGRLDLVAPAYACT